MSSRWDGWDALVIDRPPIRQMRVEWQIFSGLHERGIKFSDQDRAACVLDQSELPSLAYPYGPTAVKHRANHAAKSAGGDMSWRTARCMRRTPQGSTSPA